MKKISLTLALALSALSASVFANTTAPATDSANQSANQSAIVDPSMDLEQTMKTMGRNFRTLERSTDWAERKAAVEQLSTYTLQAKAQGLSNPDASEDDKKAYEEGMNKLYEQIGQLQAAVNAQDEEKVKSLVDEIKQTRRQGHQYFKVN